ncbi:MAG TPA: hypothetical protein VIT91_13570 [Chthoniobacterales bacterium]
MKKSLPPFDRVVERHYPAIYEAAAGLTPDPVKAAVLTQRAFRRAQTLIPIRYRCGKTREALVKILFLEFAAGTFRATRASTSAPALRS